MCAVTPGSGLNFWLTALRDGRSKQKRWTQQQVEEVEDYLCYESDSGF